MTAGKSGGPVHRPPIRGTVCVLKKRRRRLTARKLAPLVNDVARAYHEERVPRVLYMIPRAMRDRVVGALVCDLLAQLEAVRADTGELDRWRRLAVRCQVSPVVVRGVVTATPAERVTWLRDGGRH